MFQQTNEGIILYIKVVPNAQKSEWVNAEDEYLKLRIAAVPDKGLANKELSRFLSTFFDVPKSSVLLLSGDTSRHKKILIKNLELKDLENKLVGIKRKKL